MSIENEGHTGLRHHLGAPSVERLFEAFQEWSQRFTLSLTVGNGAGLLATLTMLSDPTKAALWPWAILSAWLFFVGTLLSGFLPVVHSAESWSLVMSKAITEIAANENELVLRQRVVNAVYDLLVQVRWLARWIAAGCFALGILIPLMIRTAQMVADAF